jgi:hypothetical protein
MNAEILAEVERLEITRLCHLTPLRNLVHIATGAGLLSSKALTETERKAFNPQDLERWDGHPDHICCSVEYPNAWYYRQKAGNDEIFRTWVMMTIHPRRLAEDETRFCHRNASASSGAFVRSGIEGFRGMYDSPVLGSGGRTYTRIGTHLRQCPTDNQAEVLVPRFIPIEDVKTIILPSEEQAANVFYGLEQIGGDPERFTFTVAPVLFQAWSLSVAISGGTRPEERIWNPS